MTKIKPSPKIQAAILSFLKDNKGTEMTRKTISHALEIHKRDFKIFEKSLNVLVEQGAIRRTKGHTFVYEQLSRQTGELHLTRAGYGFVEIEGRDDDVFVARNNLNTAFDRDIVEVQFYAKSSGKRQEAYITRIIKRFREMIVGTYKETEYYHFVTPDSTKIYRDIIITADESGKAKDGQKVVVRFEGWESDQHNPEGVITDVLGMPDDPGVDVVSVAYNYNLPVYFTKEVENEARKVATKISDAELVSRMDLRDLICFTIDPEDAQDFDDAVSLEELPNGNLQLGVHIADVSHYVQADTVLDKEAYRRGTSIYLVDRVIPMLPERLSNDMCSLKPNVDRLAFTCLMELDDDLNVVDHTITPSVIHSRKRFTYQEFQDVYDNHSDNPLYPVIKRMYALSKRLTTQRFKDGSIDFDSPEVRFILDEKGKPVDVIPKKRLLSHRLVEEFMLMANKTVAHHVGLLKQYRGGAPFLYRVHEKPSDEKMLRFYNFLKALKIPFKPVKKISSKYFQEILASIKGTNEETIIGEVALRSMMKAVYSEINIGHFGLSFEDYTHFTSPIRRYPDLIVHRMLRLYAAEGVKDVKGMRKRMHDIAEHSSKRERLAVEAERESIKLKQVEYIQKHIGETFHGFISGVTSFGIFVELEDTYIEGLVQMARMSDDYYIYDEVSYSMTGRHSGRHIRLGDKVEIRVESVDLEKREVEFALLEDPDFVPVAPVVQAGEKKEKSGRRRRRKKK